MSQYLFVYGTLRSGQAPAKMMGFIRQLRRVGVALVHGRLCDLGRYPGAILDPSSDTFICGDVFELPDNQAALASLLASLDMYECFDPTDLKGSLYVRTQCLATLHDGRELECWIYVYNRDTGAAPLIADGDYVKAKGNRNCR